MRRWVWAIIAVLFIIYCVVVYSWWLEGNRNEIKFEQERNSEAAHENSLFGH
jgi:hypothetical protein